MTKISDTLWRPKNDVLGSILSWNFCTTKCVDREMESCVPLVWVFPLKVEAASTFPAAATKEVLPASFSHCRSYFWFAKSQTVYAQWVNQAEVLQHLLLSAITSPPKSVCLDLGRLEQHDNMLRSLHEVAPKYRLPWPPFFSLDGKMLPSWDWE